LPCVSLHTPCSSAGRHLHAMSSTGSVRNLRLCLQESLADKGDPGVDITRSRSAETEPEATQAPSGFQPASDTEVRQPLRDAAENGARADNTLAAWPVSGASVTEPPRPRRDANPH